jgi:hypothetical protein
MTIKKAFLLTLMGVSLTVVAQASVDCPDKNVVGKKISILGDFRQGNLGNFEWQRDFHGNQVPLAERRFDEKTWKVYGKDLHNISNLWWGANANKYVFAKDPEVSAQGAHRVCTYKIEPSTGSGLAPVTTEFVFVTLDEALQKRMTKTYSSRMLGELEGKGKIGDRSGVVAKLKPVPTRTYYSTYTYEGAYTHMRGSLENSSMMAASENLTKEAANNSAQIILKKIG